MIYHLIVGDMAAAPLREAVAAEPSMQGEVVVLKDILHAGPLQKGEGQTFSALRSAYWQEVTGNDKATLEVTDMERLLEVSNELYKDADAQVWFWMAPAPADVCAYHWLLFYLSKHLPRFLLVNIAGLPFLNEAGKVYYPKSIAEILPRELIKARRLARPVTPAEVELDGEEWRRLMEANDGIRTHEGGKKLAGRPEDFYDDQLLGCCSERFVKASKVLTQAMSKHSLPTGDLHLAWRLRTMAAEGRLQLQGDSTRTFRDWEVRLPGSASEPAAETSAS